MSAWLWRPGPWWPPAEGFEAGGRDGREEGGLASLLLLLADLHLSFPLTGEKAHFLRHRSWNVPFTGKFSSCISMPEKVHVVREVMAQDV